MSKTVIYTEGGTEAIRHASALLHRRGYTVTAVPTEAVTHLLLPVPSLEKDGRVKGGGPLTAILDQLPADVTVLGGNLPPLACRCIDFLKDEPYLLKNAAITARCAFARIRQSRPITADTGVLIIGWGRIGKQLAPLLQASGAAVTVSARKAADLQEVTAQGYSAVETGLWDTRGFDIIVNTVPAPLLDQTDTKPEALLMDLASLRGIEGDRVIWARGLPNSDAPEESGMLIAETAVRFLSGKEQI